MLHGKCIGEVNGLTESADSTKHKGKVALLYGTCVDEVDKLTDGAFVSIWLAKSSIDAGKVILRMCRRGR